MISVSIFQILKKKTVILSSKSGISRQFVSWLMAVAWALQQHPFLSSSFSHAKERTEFEAEKRADGRFSICCIWPQKFCRSFFFSLSFVFYASLIFLSVPFSICVNILSLHAGVATLNAKFVTERKEETVLPHTERKKITALRCIILAYFKTWMRFQLSISLPDGRVKVSVETLML